MYYSRFFGGPFLYAAQLIYEKAKPQVISVAVYGLCGVIILTP